MKVKKIILFCCVFVSSLLPIGIMHHTLVSTSEQKIMGRIFKHVMTSGDVQDDHFLIDGKSVTQMVYEQELEKLQKQAWQKEYDQQMQMRRSKIDFALKAKMQVTEKLLIVLTEQIEQLFDQIANPALEKFFVFTDATIVSQDQLAQLQAFVEHVEKTIQQKIEQGDIENLNLLYTKLEQWPSRLEKFFQDTVHNAIKKSDDTVMLKELLKLVCEPSFA